jgi:hypothetical protein
VTKLPARTQQLYDLLFGRGEVLVTDIYAAMGGPAEATYTQAQWLGPYITRLNRRLAKHGQKIVPGDLKRTYRLVKLR